MNSPEPAAGGLADFRERLQGGVYQSVTASRPADFDIRDEQALRAWPAKALAALERITADTWDGSNEAIGQLTEHMRSQRTFLAAVLFSPSAILNRLLTSYGPAGENRPALAWTGMCWIGEAAWRAVNGDLPAEAGFAADDAALLRPLAARLRFLVLSEPSRWRGETAGSWWAQVPDRIPGGNRVLSRAFGLSSWHLLIANSQRARREWLGFLDAYQAHPLLAQAKPGQLEQELHVLVLRRSDPRPFRHLAAPLGLSVRPLADPAPLTAEDDTVIADVTERHLLPRFAVSAVACLALYDDSPRAHWAAALAALAVVMAGLTAVGCAAALLVRPAAVAAAVCYLLICAGVLFLPVGWGSMWLLRMPAASAVGLLALVSLLPAAWIHTPLHGWLAAAALTAVSFGYLLIEVRNHGVARGSAVPRALAVAVIGAVHALMVSLIGLVAVAPAFVANGASLGKLWAKPAYEHAGMVLVLAAAWCLTVGVFSQILWDDRPITAPLAHLSWRSRP